MYRSICISLALVTASACAKTKQEEPLAQTSKTSPSDAARAAEGKAQLDDAARRLTTNFSRVHFSLDSSELNADSREALAANSEIMRAHAGLSVDIEGHCDDRGTTDYNLALGQKRAESIRDYLVRQGISKARLTATSYGKERPLATGHTETAWSQNRRAEFRVTVADATSAVAGSSE